MIKKFVSRVNDVISNPHVIRTVIFVRYVGDVMSSLASEKSNVVKFAKLGDHTFKMLESISRNETTTFRGWVHVDFGEFTKVVLNVFNGRQPNFERYNVEYETNERVYDIDGTKFGVTVSINNSNTSIYVPFNKAPIAKQFIYDRIWTTFKNTRNLVLTSSTAKRKYSGTDETFIEIVEDDVSVVLDSKFAATKATWFASCAKCGVNRSLMLHGRPGTGKSMIAKSIIKRLGYRSFRVSLADINSINVVSLIRAIEIFKPEALVIDDFERMDGGDEMLQFLERVHGIVKLTVMTVNDIERVSLAMRRPRRIDEIEEVTMLDDDVVKNVLSEFADEMFERVKSWPIAYIDEAVTLRRLNGNLDHVEPLEKRMLRNHDSYGSRDNDRSENDH